jgi:hypothetical protein
LPRSAKLFRRRSARACDKGEKIKSSRLRDSLPNSTPFEPRTASSCQSSIVHRT